MCSHKNLSVHNNFICSNPKLEQPKHSLADGLLKQTSTSTPQNATQH